MPNLAARPWVPHASEDLVQQMAASLDRSDAADTIESLIERSETIHNVECINLNPATNSMSTRAKAALTALEPRPSLGYPGAKYETGLEAIEQIEVIAAELAAMVFGASYAEVRLASGALANLYAFMATSAPGDTIIAPPATIGGHVTHHVPGAAGLYGLDIHPAPIAPERYTVDVDGVAELAARVKPSLITIGCSLNLTHHDVPRLREIADSVGAKLLFDAAHLSGPIAGSAWPNPLEQGAHLMTMSTYKSLAGPAAGILVTNEADLAERVDAIAFPGLTANFDAAKTAALAITLAEWTEHGSAHADAMVSAARHLAAELMALDVPLFTCDGEPTASHAFAIDAREFGGGGAAALHLRKANMLACAIGLPSGTDDGMRIGTNELVRWGATADDMPELAGLIAAALASDDPDSLAGDATAFRSGFSELQYC